MEKFRVSLALEERAALEHLISAGKAASRKLTHARILLLADAVQAVGQTEDDIVTALGTSLKTIARVRKRFVTEGINEAIDPRPQPSRSDKIKTKGDVEQKLIKLACSEPPRGRCHWTLQLLADEMVVLGLVDSISTETVRQALKKRHPSWIVQSWCIPLHANAEFVWRMEDVIQTYMLPCDPKWPVVCFDEASRQLFGEVRRPELACPGAPARVDYEYERKGVCCQLMVREPLQGWRHVTVTDRRTRQVYARCIRDLVDRHYPHATKIRLVQDNLNTHDGASFYETFQPDEARRILSKIEIHYTPKQGSWLNMAETEINIMERQCLDWRLDNRSLMADEIAAWEEPRNARKARIHWTFTLAAARQKLRKLYPSIED